MCKEMRKIESCRKGHEWAARGVSRTRMLAYEGGRNSFAPHARAPMGFALPAPRRDS